MAWIDARVRSAVRPVHRWLLQQRHRLSGGRATTRGKVPARAEPVTAPAARPRRRTGADVQSSVRLLFLVHDHTGYPVEWPESPADWLCGPELLAAWVIKPAASVLAHIAVSRPGDDPVETMRWREVTGRDPSSLGLVRRFFVHPQSRGQGFGSRLLDVAEADVRRRGRIPAVEVGSASEHAIRLFEDRGWELLAIYPWGDGTTDLQVRYYLAASAEGTSSIPSTR
jgi:GNAT superfamily N-acetyltransferase